MSKVDNLTEEEFMKLVPPETLKSLKKESNEPKEKKIHFKREGEAVMAKVVSFGYSFLDAKNKEERDKLIQKYCLGGDSDLIAVREVYLIRFLNNYKYLSNKEQTEEEDEEVKEALDLNEKLIEGIDNIMSYIYDDRMKEEKEEDERRIKEIEDKAIPTGETYNLAKVKEDGNLEVVAQYTLEEKE